MDFSRRELLLASGAAVALRALPAFAQTAGNKAAEDTLAKIADRILSLYPENATTLGVDKDRPALKAKLTDRSPAGQAAIASAAKEMLAQARAIDPAGLDEATRIDVDVVRTSLEMALDGLAFPYGDSAVLNSNWSYRNAPYAVSQNTGAFVEIPDLLDTSHTVANAADAEAYLARLQSYAAQLDGETERLKSAGAMGVIAPDFILDTTLKQQRTARAMPFAEWGLVTALTKKTKDIPGAWSTNAQKLCEERVAPAMDRQIAVLQAHREKATHDAGVWKLPQGEAYYAWALSAGTTTKMTPDEVHKMGLDELKRFQSEMDTILKTQGYTKGSVGERMTALGKDKRFLYPDNDEGRAQIIAYLQDRLTDVRGRLPKAFATLVQGKLVVKRVPPAIEAGAPGAYAGPGPIDGSLPGNFYINLETTSVWPRYALPTLAYHEGIPGHVWQGEYTYKLPLVRSILAFNAYSEGWALYAEQLAGELGVYDEDPVGRLGYLQSMAFRACRLVVDTGLHAKRWSREQAIEWFTTTNGSTVEEVRGEVDRYCSWPGQACGYKVGHTHINQLRDKAKTALGSKFDFRRFNDALVLGGNVPMTVLDRVIDAEIARQRG